MGEEEDSTLDSYLQQFSHIKKEGKPCPVEEARKFYVLALQESQKRTILCNCELAENMNQKIPYYKLGEEDYAQIVDDLRCVKEQITVFEQLLLTIKVLYKNKKDYNAYVLEEPFTIEVEGEEKEAVKKTYYIEKKEVRDKRREELYI